MRFLVAAIIIASFTGCVGVKEFYSAHKDTLVTAVKIKADGRVHDECVEETIKIIEEELGIIEEAE